MVRAQEEGVQVAVVSAKVESELNELPKEEAKVRGLRGCMTSEACSVCGCTCMIRVGCQ
jgi:hypothetical protein